MRRILIPLLLAAGLLAAGQPGAASAATTVAGLRLSTFEATLLGDINDARAKAGLGALAARPGPTDVARGWAAHQAKANAMSHNPDYAGELQSHGCAHWTWAAENVGYISSSRSSTELAHALFTAYMNSEPHRKNILNPKGSVLGIGVVARTADGRTTYFNTLDFTNDYDSAYGRARQPAFGLRSEARALPSGTVASFERGNDGRVLTTSSGSGTRASGLRVDSPAESVDDAVRVTVARTTSDATGAAGIALRDALDLSGARTMRLRLQHSASKPLVVRVSLGEYLNGTTTVATLTVQPGAAQTFAVALPSPARAFRNTLAVSVTSGSLKALSGTLGEQRAVLSVYGVSVSA